MPARASPGRDAAPPEGGSLPLPGCAPTARANVGRSQHPRSSAPFASRARATRQSSHELTTRAPLPRLSTAPTTAAPRSLSRPLRLRHRLLCACRGLASCKQETIPVHAWCVALQRHRRVTIRQIELAQAPRSPTVASIRSLWLLISEAAACAIKAAEQHTSTSVARPSRLATLATEADRVATRFETNADLLAPRRGSPHSAAKAFDLDTGARLRLCVRGTEPRANGTPSHSLRAALPSDIAEHSTPVEPSLRTRICQHPEGHHHTSGLGLFTALDRAHGCISALAARNPA